MTISKDKTYRTRNGLEVRIYATDGQELWPVHGAIKCESGWRNHSWTDSGHTSIGDNELIEVRPRIQRTYWANVYERHTAWYDTKEYADSVVTVERLACVRIEIDCEEGEGL